MITKNSVVLCRDLDIDYGVISKIEDDGGGGHIKYWSAWTGHEECSWCELTYLSLLGPPILGVFNEDS